MKVLLFSIILNPIFLKAQDNNTYEKDLSLGNKYYHLADMLYENIDTCMKYSELAIPLLKKTKEWNKYVSTLCGLSYCYNTKEEFEAMSQNNILAMGEAMKLLSPSQDGYLCALNNFALVYSEIREDYITALKYYKEVYQNYHDCRIGGRNDRAEGPIKENIGHMYSQLGDFKTALDYYKQAEENFKNITYNGKPSIPYFQLAKLYDKYAKLYVALNDFEKAKNYQFKSFQTLEKSTIFNINFKIRFSIELAKISLILEDVETADQLLQDLQNQHALLPLQQAKVFHYQGLVFLKKNDYVKALEFLHKSLDHKVPEHKVRGKAKTYRSLSHLYTKMKAPKLALQTQQKAIKLLTYNSNLPDDLAVPVLSDKIYSRIELFHILSDKGKTLQDLYQQHKHDKYLKAGLETYVYLSTLTDDIRSLYQSKESQLSLLDNAKDFYESAIKIAFILYNKEKTSEYLEQAFYFAEKSKSNLLIDELRKKSFLKGAVLGDSLLQQEYQLKAEINYYQKIIANEIAKEDTFDQQKIKSVEKVIFKKQKTLADLYDDIEEKYPIYATLSKQQPITVNELQQKLIPSQAVVKYFVGQSNIYIFNISKDKTEFIQVPNDFNLDKELACLFEYLKMSSINGRDDYATTAFVLYEKLLAPLDFSKNKELIIIPDGQLENLPFDILVTSRDKIPSAKMLPYLIYTHTISYAYSATVLKSQMEKKPAPYNTVLGVFPVFENTSKSLNHSKKSCQNFQRFAGDFLWEKEATVNNFYEQLDKHQVLHFSTHARGVDSINHEPSIDFYDRSLALSYLQNYNMRVHLAVLSACQTNIGEYKKGEGSMSLSRGFAYAGVPSVVTSIANVKEESTSMLMKSFYLNLEQGMKKHEALRQAKIDYLKQENLVEASAAPYFWGTFLAIGNMDSIILARPSVSYWWYFFFVIGIVSYVIIFIKSKKPINY